MTLLRLLAVVAFAGATPTAAQTWRQVEPIQQQRTFVIARDGVSVTVSPPAQPPEDEAAEESESDGPEEAKVVVTFRGLPPYEVPADPVRNGIYGITVGIGRMAPGDTAPTVLIGGYSGGAHCCATLQAISLVDGRPVVATLPPKDDEPLHRFPRDIDGDGTRDLEWTDDSLLYAFASHAGSWTVPRIYSLERGTLVDVSRGPGFAALYRKLGERALATCRGDDGERNGACAAYAYVRALAGDPEGGIRTAASLAEPSGWYPTDCTVALIDDTCPEGKQREFAGFEDALRWIMRENGYLP